MERVCPATKIPLSEQPGEASDLPRTRLRRLFSRTAGGRTRRNQPVRSSRAGSGFNSSSGSVMVGKRLYIGSSTVSDTTAYPGLARRFFPNGITPY